ncbi:Hypothetical predicted protein [Prunus dulcis]|uniref:Uncharacterized protein n=1 Tax=Prunus dulcis TaxID=3755 RepID=A0A5E4FNV4_PRUDU|nr:Hypothetical predicted protein [Prunus dulcis]
MAHLDGEDRAYGDGEPITRDEFNTEIEGLCQTKNLGNQERPAKDRGDYRHNERRPPWRLEVPEAKMLVIMAKEVVGYELLIRLYEADEDFKEIWSKGVCNQPVTNFHLLRHPLKNDVGKIVQKYYACKVLQDDVLNLLQENE